MKLTIIIKKELLDQVRDKRTIIAAILMPAVIVPLLLFFTSQNTLGEDTGAPVKIILQNDEPRIKSIILESFGNTRFIRSDSPADAIIRGKADLRIDFTKSGGRYRTLTIYFDSARRVSALSYLRLHGFLKTYFSGSEIAMGDVQITSIPVRGEKENKTLITLSMLLPVLLMVFAASSTMSSVIDMSSGEKERSTIETLLSCNIPHTTIVMGKISAASVIGIISIASLMSGLVLFSHAYPGLTGGLSILKFSGLTNIILMLVIAFLSVFLFSAAGMAIGLYAKSVKEGTILSLPVIVLSSALSSGLIAGDPFSVNRLYLLVPVLNFSFLIRSVIYNHHEALWIIVSVCINMAYAFLLLFISVRLLKKEAVIFRS